MSCPWGQYQFRGSALKVGEEQGEEFKDSLLELISKRLDAMSEYLSCSMSSLLPRYSEHLLYQQKLIKEISACAYEEMDGIVRSSNSDWPSYLLAVNMTDYRDIADEEGCTSLVSSMEQGHLYGAQTWDLGVENMKHVVLVDRIIEGQPRCLALSCAGFPPLAGMNEHGFSMGTTNIKTRDHGKGLGYQSILHLALWSKNCNEALALIHKLERCGSHTYWLVDDQEGWQLDSSHSHFIPEPYGGHVLVRTNHPLPEELQRLELERATDSSIKRLRKAIQMGRDIGMPDQVLTLMSDRSAGVDSISRLEEDGTGITTNGCVLAMPVEKAIWACRGPAHGQDWIKVTFEC